MKESNTNSTQQTELDKAVSLLSDAVSQTMTYPDIRRKIQDALSACTAQNVLEKECVGKTFGRLEVIGAYRKDKQRIAICRCTCGNVKDIDLKSILKGDTKSCGCLVRDVHTTHGFATKGKRDRLYEIWKNMRQRCNNKNNRDFKYYGARGITICEEWNDYPTFLVWAMSHGYRDNLTLDRIDNDNGYSPDNCRWATRKVQVANRRKKEPVEKNQEATYAENGGTANDNQDE